MSDMGTITEIEPEDGLGWIEMETGDRVRFGGTACKGFVPAVGMVVRVLGTRPGYKGVLKATGLERVADAPKAAFAVDPSAPSAQPAPPAPRTSLHTVQSAGVRADDLLLALLGRADVDHALHADLEAISFEVHTAPGSELECPNPWFYAVGKDESGNAIGLYAHPMFAALPAQPWLYWNRGAQTLRQIADDTGALFPRLLATATQRGGDAATVARLRTTLLKLGMPDAGGHPLGDEALSPWLPPDAAELRALDDYLSETDGGEMERGLLAHAYRLGDARAKEALHSLYAGWEWSLPSWVQS